MTLFSSNVVFTALLCGISLVAVWIPFQRGLFLCLRARAATRRLSREQLRRGLETGGGPRESLALLLARVLVESLQEGSDQPREFVRDAAKQYALGEYDAHYARVISMYANLLPPLGFIGTTAGLLVLFVSMRLSDGTLELGALALALLSSIAALVGFAVLEGLKIRLYARVLGCVDDVLAHERAAATRAPRPRRAAATG